MKESTMHAACVYMHAMLNKSKHKILGLSTAQLTILSMLVARGFTIPRSLLWASRSSCLSASLRDICACATLSKRKEHAAY